MNNTVGYMDIVTMLIKNGADVTVRYEEENTVLMAATWRGFKDIVFLLLEQKGVFYNYGKGVGCFRDRISIVCTGRVSSRRVGI